MKKFKAMVALLLCASMLAACSNGGGNSSSSTSGGDASGDKPVLVVSNFALADDRIKETVIKPFEEQ